MEKETPKKLGSIKIKIESKEDGIYISSDDMPGLWLWGNPDTVFQDLIPTIQKLYELSHGKNVDVRAEERPQTSSERLSNITQIPQCFNIYEHKEMQSNRLNG